jgi:hypothetical protein
MISVSWAIIAPLQLQQTRKKRSGMRERRYALNVTIKLSQQRSGDTTVVFPVKHAMGRL